MPRSPQPRADVARVVVGPFVRKRTAFVRLHGMYSAPVVIRQPRTCAVWAAFENQPAAVGRYLRLAFDEVRFGHAEEYGNARDLRVRDAHDPVLDAAARPAAAAREPGKRSVHRLQALAEYLRHLLAGELLVAPVKPERRLDKLRYHSLRRAELRDVHRDAYLAHPCLKCG